MDSATSAGEASLATVTRLAADPGARVVGQVSPVGPGLRIAVVSNTAWNLVNFRLNLMRQLRADGHKVIAVAPSDQFVTRLEAEGFVFEPVSISIGGVNPISELRSVWQLWQALRRQRIDLVLSYTPKGNLYSALASIVRGSQFVPNVSGLGRAFIRRSPVTWAALLLYRLTFGRASRVFFQNLDDLAMFVRARLVTPDNAERVPGSGVDLSRFAVTPTPEHRPPNAPVFLLIARMLWDKGVGEYVAAARQIKKANPEATFNLLGDLGSQNPAAIPAKQVEDWVREGIVTYLGSTEDVRPHIASADCVVLPSYREGVPRVMLEAAAMGRPVITSDAPGCRDAVIDGETGFMCRVRDADDLAAKLRAFAALPGSKRQQMSVRARAFVEQRFSEERVIECYRQVVAACAIRLGSPTVREPLPEPSIAEALD
jgi:glycosyltransferase involved in cell wall biosynthesis